MSNQTNSDMNVIKRNGELEPVSFDKIIRRIRYFASNPTKLTVDSISVAQKVIGSIKDNMSTTEIDNHTCEVAANNITDHPDYGILATRISVSNHQKNTIDCFTGIIEKLYRKKRNGKHCPSVNKNFYKFVNIHKGFLNEMMKPERDNRLNFFGLSTLLSKYLLKDDNGVVVETPQSMWARVAIAIHMNRTDIKDVECLKRIKETYDNMSLGYFTHASPTLFNLGTNYEQGISCVLLGSEDSIGGIFKTVSDCAQLCKGSAGIGLHFSMIRASGSHVSTTNGRSSGICPFIKVLNNTARAVDQGGKRNGSIAIYLEPWHPDIMEFLKLKRPTGDEHSRARDLFYALWVCDIFMKRVEEDGKWSLFEPDVYPELVDLYGDEFEKRYIELENSGSYCKQLNARTVWNEILITQTETGMPYMSYKDAVNRKSNHQNIGTIKSSNLCNEINLYSDNKQYANCILSSICLPRFVEMGGSDGETPTINYEKIKDIAGVVTRNLDNIIDINKYSVKESKLSNMLHRPLGIGVQGLADMYLLMRVPFDSDEAKEINKKVFETIYYGALLKSHQLAKEKGAYKSFKGSPFSKGILQYHMWGLTEKDLSGMWDFKSLIVDIKRDGVRNSTLTALMPTASTSQIQGNNECFEPYTSNIYKRKTLSGEFIVINEHLIRDLIKLGIWNENTMNELIISDGSVQGIDGVTDEIKSLYKTSWEMSAKVLLTHSAERGPFVDQTQSLNVFMTNTSTKALTSMHFYGWKLGLKTGMYYLRSKTASSAKKFGLNTSNFSKTPTTDPPPPPHEKKAVKESVKEKAKRTIVCTEDVCISCQG